MDFVNKSPVKAGWTMGFDRDGRELLIVAVKATFTIPDLGRPPELAKELQDFVRGKLAEYKRPRWVEFVAELPKTGTGKTQRFKLREER